MKGLLPLTVLTGPNNSGKSTCLEAICLAVGEDPAAQFAHVVKRRGWLGLDSVNFTLAAGRCHFVAEGGLEHVPRPSVLPSRWSPSLLKCSRTVTIEALREPRETGLERARQAQLALPIREIEVGGDGRRRNLVIDNAGAYEIYDAVAWTGENRSLQVRLLDPAAQPGDLDRAWREVTLLGRAAQERLTDRSAHGDRRWEQTPGPHGQMYGGSYRSSGRSPVRREMRASIRGPISSLS
ncbi:MAG: AAA family ATPase [Planctomycetes bacterium]|nr:AAA family ATPase [Planctomycetota bacterium]